MPVWKWRDCWEEEKLHQEAFGVCVEAISTQLNERGRAAAVLKRLENHWQSFSGLREREME